MNTFDKIRSFCSTFRIIIGLVIITAGFYFTGEEMYNLWFVLGAVPVIAGLTKFCPLCIVSKKCTIPNKED